MVPPADLLVALAACGRQRRLCGQRRGCMHSGQCKAARAKVEGCCDTCAHANVVCKSRLVQSDREGRGSRREVFWNLVPSRVLSMPKSGLQLLYTLPPARWARPRLLSESDSLLCTLRLSGYIQHNQNCLKHSALMNFVSGADHTSFDIHLPLGNQCSAIERAIHQQPDLPLVHLQSNPACQ